MNVTMQVLRAFKAAAETGSFTHAAEKTYMTQPAFSRLIASLEAELGVKLFERTTRRVVLTAEGESCLWRINQILDTYDLMLSDIERMKHSRAGNLAMGYNPVSGPPEFIVRALKRLGEEYPNIRVSLVRAYSNELVEMVGDGRLDCALVSSAYFTDTSGMEIKPLQPIHLYALVSRDNGLAAVEELSARHLKGVPLVFMSNTAPRTRKTVLHEFEKQGIPLTEDPAVEDLEVCANRKKLTFVSGRIMRSTLPERIEKLCTKLTGLDADLNFIRNDYFGENVTVTGLITGTDIIAQLKDKELGDALILPSVMLRDDKFLDDISVSDVEKALGIRIVPIPCDGAGAVDAIAQIVEK